MTASGEPVFKFFPAHSERRMIQEGTQIGLVAARAQGRLGGRKPIEPTDTKVKMAKAKHYDRGMQIKGIYGTLRISISTYYRYAEF